VALAVELESGQRAVDAGEVGGVVGGRGAATGDEKRVDGLGERLALLGVALGTSVKGAVGTGWASVAASGGGGVRTMRCASGSGFSLPGNMKRPMTSAPEARMTSRSTMPSQAAPETAPGGTPPRWPSDAAPGAPPPSGPARRAPERRQVRHERAEVLARESGGELVQEQREIAHQVGGAR
jgi:hypothetical protein